MYEPKADIYTILSEIENVVVYQSRPEVIKDFPSLTFYIGNNIPTYVLEKEIGFQDIDVMVDIYATNSIESGEILTLLEEKMLENSYRLSFCTDVPDDEASHITTRFNLIY